jgi:hypothetical protein
MKQINKILHQSMLNVPLRGRTVNWWVLPMILDESNRQTGASIEML